MLVFRKVLLKPCKTPSRKPMTAILKETCMEKTEVKKIKKIIPNKIKYFVEETFSKSGT